MTSSSHPSSRSQPSLAELEKHAFKAFRAGQLDRANKLCGQIRERQPRNEAAAFLAGIVAGRVGNHQQSERLLRDAIAFDPNSARAHLHLGSLFRQQGRLEEAEAEISEAVRINTGDPVAHNDLGVVYLAQRRWSDAANCFLRAIAIQPNFALACYNLGVAQQGQSQNVEALASFRHAAAAAPTLAEAHAKVGDLLAQCGQYQEAIACFRRAAALRPNSAVADLNLAKAHIHEHDPAAAETCLRRVLARDSGNSDAWRLLGIALPQLGRFDEAAESLRKCLELDPRQIIAYRDLIHTKKFTPADLPLIGRARDLLSTPALTDRDRAALHFALGKALDDVGDYAQALAHFDKGNRLEASRHNFNAAAHRASIDLTISLYPEDFLGSRATAADGSETPLLIVGMMRSGTTLVEQILSSHPDIGAGGELTFWGDAATRLGQYGYDQIGHANQERLAGEYLALLRRVSPGAIRVTDKMPHNFLWLGLIHAILPGARIIHCRRSAIDTCLSIYFTQFGAPVDFAYDPGNIVAFYEEYHRLMAYWRKSLPEDRFIEVDYEAIVVNREAEARRLIEFCGLAWHDACLHHEKNQRVITTSSVWQARQQIYTTSVERWRRYEAWLGEFNRLRPYLQTLQPESGVES